MGTFSSTDVDNTTFTYTLVAGAGDDDNASFAIEGDILKTVASFDYETKISYSIRVQTDDRNGGTLEKQFTITVTDVNDAPVIETNTGLSVTQGTKATITASDAKSQRRR